MICFELYTKYIKKTCFTNRNNPRFCLFLNQSLQVLAVSAAQLEHAYPVSAFALSGFTQVQITHPPACAPCTKWKQSPVIPLLTASKNYTGKFTVCTVIIKQAASICYSYRIHIIHSTHMHTHTHTHTTYTHTHTYTHTQTPTHTYTINQSHYLLSEP